MQCTLQCMQQCTQQCSVRSSAVYAIVRESAKPTAQRNLSGFIGDWGLQVSHHISEYTDIIQKLREEVTSLKNELGNATSMPHRSAHGDRAPSRGATDEYENIRDIVFAHYSEKLDLVRHSEHP